jgi:hypothetical protein
MFLVFDLVELGTKTVRQTALYAILILLSRLLPSRMENPKDEHVEKSLLPYVSFTTFSAFCIEHEGETTFESEKRCNFVQNIH